METVISNEAVTVSVAVSAYGIILCHLAVPVLLCYYVTSLGSSSSVYADMLS